MSRAGRVMMLGAIGGSALLAIAVMMVVKSVTSRPFPKKESPRAPAVRNVGVGLRRSSWMDLPDERKAQYLDENFERVEDRSELLAVLPKAKIPKDTGGRKLIGMYLSPRPVKGFRADREFMAVYTNGLRVFTEVIPDDGSDPAAGFAAELDTLKQAEREGSLKADKLPFLYKVGPAPGIASEPGYNIDGAEKEPRPGFIKWASDGYLYKVYGYGMSVKQLRQVADSMQ